LVAVDCPVSLIGKPSGTPEKKENTTSKWDEPVITWSSHKHVRESVSIDVTAT
jgi:hypothetical protein